MPLPEAPARKKIDQLLLAADWHACDIGHATIHAALSGAIEFAPRIISNAQLKKVPFTSIGIEQLHIVVEIEKRFSCFDETKLIETASWHLSRLIVVVHDTSSRSAGNPNYFGGPIS